MFNIFRRLFPRFWRNDPSARLKKHGLRIIARVEDCEVKPYINWEDQASVFPAQLEIGTNEGYSLKPEGSFIEYSYQGENGKTITMRSPFIRKDKITLSILLLQLREISIYIHPANPDLYYFDLGDLTAFI